MSLRRMPRQRPGKSRQDYGTPLDLIRAVEARFGALHVDLAARADNTKAPHFISLQRDSLSVSWSSEYPGELAWLNPPFARIGPWARKCAVETEAGRGLRIALLTPASVGAKWFLEHVHGRALVLSLNPRITFEGCKTPFPKDCILSVFGLGETGFAVWQWSSAPGLPASVLGAAERLARAELAVIRERAALAAAAVDAVRPSLPPGQDAHDLAGRLLSSHNVAGGRWSRRTVLRALAAAKCQISTRPVPLFGTSRAVRIANQEGN